MALGQIAALVGSQGVKYLLDQRAQQQQEREQARMDAMAKLQGSLKGQPQRSGMAGPPGGIAKLKSVLIRYIMIQNMMCIPGAA